MSEFTKTLDYNGPESIAKAEFIVDISNKLVGPVIVTNLPIRPSKSNRSVVVKVPQKFIEQLQTLPIELEGVPLSILVRFAHAIKEDEGQSVIECLRSQEVDPTIKIKE